ncbi:porin family protein [Microbacter margulisiae]|uniref:Outer membrane protein beta-barrel domain-containing protein n=1 Tax=Microbacter margulisiae TaxID=1350067 RepID=A0A7W5H0M8_9PORP|nr:porin family protein [Microbacter margulisiae]MBB3185855.1 hypothetical protein [Microbacter margulisiae]
MQHTQHLFPKRLFIAISVIIITPSLVAQSHYSFGALVGVNSATLTNTINATPRNGMVVGIFSDYRFTKYFGFEPELDYSMEGAYQGQEFIRTNYLNVPLMVKVFLTDNFNIQMGPQFGFCLNTTGKATDIDGNPYNIQSISDINPFDFDLTLGVGYELPKGLMIQTRYFIGALGVDKRGTLLNDKTTNQHNLNSVFQIMLGWKF